jgi:rRNA methylases
MLSAAMTQEIITSSQNQYVQEVRALLNQPKARRKLQAFAAEGARLVEDGLRSGARARYVLVRAAHAPRVESALSLRPDNLPILNVEDRLFDSLADTVTSQGVLGVFDLPEWQLPDALNFALILDQVRDPGNLGSILRSAEAAGAQAALLSPGTTDAFAPKVVRAGMGAHFRLPILNLDWELMAVVLAGLNVYHADMDGELSCWEAGFPGSLRAADWRRGGRHQPRGKETRHPQRADPDGGRE